MRTVSRSRGLFEVDIARILERRVYRGEQADLKAVERAFAAEALETEPSCLLRQGDNTGGVVST